MSKNYPICGHPECSKPITEDQVYMQFAIGYTHPGGEGTESGTQFIFHYPVCFYAVRDKFPERVEDLANFLEQTWVQRHMVPQISTEQIQEMIADGTIGEHCRTAPGKPDGPTGASGGSAGGAADS